MGLLDPISRPTKNSLTGDSAAGTLGWVGSVDWEKERDWLTSQGRKPEDIYGTEAWKSGNEKASSAQQAAQNTHTASVIANGQAVGAGSAGTVNPVAGGGNAAAGGTMLNGTDLGGTALPGTDAAASSGGAAFGAHPSDAVIAATNGTPPATNAGGTPGSGVTGAGGTKQTNGVQGATTQGPTDFNTSMQNFMQSMQTFMPPPPSAPSLDQQAANANMMAGKAYKTPELTQDQLNRISSAWQAQQLINEGSPLLGLAQAKASQAGNARGLLNSTANINAGTQAMLAEAGNYGRADAQNYGSVLQSDRTADARSRDVFAGAAFEDARSQREAEAQYRNTMLQSGANVYKGLLDQDFTRQQDATRRGWSVEDRNFNRTGQIEDRDFNRAGQVEDRNFNRTGQIEDRNFIRTGQIEDRDSNQTFTGKQNDLNRGVTVSEGTANRQATKDNIGLSADAQIRVGAASAGNTMAINSANVGNSIAVNSANTSANLAASLTTITTTAGINATTATTKAQRDLRDTYDADIKATQFWLDTEIEKIQNSDLLPDLKTARIKAVQKTATDRADWITSIAKANPDWVQGWTTFSINTPTIVGAANPATKANDTKVDTTVTKKDETKADTTVTKNDTTVTDVTTTTGLLNNAALPTTIGTGAGAQSASSLSSGAQGFVASIIANGWMTPQGAVVPGNERKIYDAAKAIGLKGADAAQINVWAKANGLPELT